MIILSRFRKPLFIHFLNILLLSVSCSQYDISNNSTEPIDKNLRIPAIKTANTTWGGNLQSSSTITQSENIVQSGTLVKFTPDTTTYPAPNFNANLANVFLRVSLYFVDPSLNVT